jgi:hypothetical protein
MAVSEPHLALKSGRRPPFSCAGNLLPAVRAALLSSGPSLHFFGGKDVCIVGDDWKGFDRVLIGKLSDMRLLEDISFSSL